MIGDLRSRGFSVVRSVMTKEQCATMKEAAYRAQAAFLQEIGADRAKRAGEIGVVRAPMKYDGNFFAQMMEPIGAEVINQELSQHAILHLQNLFILPPDRGDKVFQSTYHRDFPRYVEGARVSLNCFYAVTEFTEQNGALRVLPGSHQTRGMPDESYLTRYGEPVVCPSGSMIVFDSTLIHAAGVNQSHNDRIAINMQFTHHWIKPQLDYCRLLGDEVVLSQPKRVQKLMGWDARVPSSLDEYYRPASERVYKGGQG